MRGVAGRPTLLPWLRLQRGRCHRATRRDPMTDARTLIETLVAAFNRGDIATILAHIADDCSLRETRAPELPYAGTFSGSAGAAKFFDAMLGVIEPSRLDIDLWVCAGEDVVDR